MISNRFCTTVFFILEFWTSMVAGWAQSEAYIRYWEATHPELSWTQIKTDLQKVALPSNPCKSLPVRPNQNQLFDANWYCKNAHEGYLQHVAYPLGFIDKCRGSNYPYFPSPACHPRNEQARSDFRCTVSVVKRRNLFRRLTFRRPGYTEVDLEKCVEDWDQLDRV